VGQCERQGCYGQNAPSSSGLVWVTREWGGIGLKTREGRNRAHAGANSPGGPENTFGNVRIGFWPTPIHPGPPE
jgi:hypothetical protein